MMYAATLEYKNSVFVFVADAIDHDTAHKAIIAAALEIVPHEVTHDMTCGTILEIAKPVLVIASTVEMGGASLLSRLMLALVDREKDTADDDPTTGERRN